MSVLHYFWQAGWVVKLVMLLLLGVSVFSWTVIFQRKQHIKQIREKLTAFNQQFWASGDLTTFYNTLKDNADAIEGLGQIFMAGFQEFLRAKQQAHITPERLIDSVQRAMHNAEVEVTDSLEQHLSFLATIGSTAPYVGLFGTVWGIMTSFQALGSVQQATIAMVAPGISEALVATALGLFAAIPAVVAYNQLMQQVEKINRQLENFQRDFINLVGRAPL